MGRSNDSPLAPKVLIMKKILRIFSLSFVLALLPVAFHGDEEALFGAAVGVQDGCAQGPRGSSCQYTGNWFDMCRDGEEPQRFHRADVSKVR